MRNRFAVLAPGKPDPVILHRSVLIQQVCLAVVAQVAIVTLAAGLFKPLARVLPIASSGLSTLFALAALFSTLSLVLADAGRSRRRLVLSQIFAVFTALIAAAILCETRFQIPSGMAAFVSAGHVPWRSGGISLWPATGFAFLAVVMILSPLRRRPVTHLLDIFGWGLCFLTLTLFLQSVFGATRLSGASNVHLASLETLACLVPLTVVAALRQAEHGVFSIFLGYGLGSKIARVLTPVVILLPFLRETARAHLLGTHLIPASYVVAVLASVGTGVAFILLLLLAWRINSMERKIHDLSLRDELTGLYNLRGFYLLADQALRMAYRSHMPFSVLFIDLDNLKQINDQLGHHTGSFALAETAKLLNATFRETDVIGRVGGDEFVVAGPFDRKSGDRAIQRLNEGSKQHNFKKGKPFTLTFSVGCATTDHVARQSLTDLVARADDAMYQEKRSKKVRA